MQCWRKTGLLLYIPVWPNKKLFCLHWQAALEVIEAEKASLYWAGKELERGKKLGDYIGKNEKTKIVCKLQVGNLNFQRQFSQTE